MPVCLLYEKSVAFCASVSLFMLLCRPPLPLGQQYGILTHSNAFLPQCILGYVELTILCCSTMHYTVLVLAAVSFCAG